MFESLQRPILSVLRFPPKLLRRLATLCFSSTSSMADFQLLHDHDIPHTFLCCVCLDLLYKPIVLSCGHISCFWCVHKSMSGYRESHCPLCRQPYHHFPTICEILHLLILKIYPLAYKTRENQILEEERKTGHSSPQFDFLACGYQAGKKMELLEDSANAGNGEMNANTKKDNVVTEFIFEEISEVVRSVTIESLKSIPDVHGRKAQNPEKIPVAVEQNQGKISVADVLCQACIQLLFRPVVLNCGHAFCESCTNSQVEKLKCHVCGSLQPRGFPNVCLELDQFLKEHFPQEYSFRRESVELKLANTIERESPTSGSCERVKKGEDVPKWDEVASMHSGVGCDFCGMYPIIGDRYKCEDCFEKIGFDLCGECYNTRSKRPGRFNQQHRPEHKFTLVRPTTLPNLRFGIVTEMLEEVSTTFIIANDDGMESSDDDMGGILDLRLS